MNALATIAPKLAKLIPLLGSDKLGEVGGAASAIGRTLKAGGCDWHDLAAAIGGALGRSTGTDRPPIPDMLKALLAADTLSAWERRFCSDLARAVWSGSAVSAAQADKLAEIYLQRCSR